MKLALFRQAANREERHPIVSRVTARAALVFDSLLPQSKLQLFSAELYSSMSKSGIHRGGFAVMVLLITYAESLFSMGCGEAYRFTGAANSR
jgi:hypothetical protein